MSICPISFPKRSNFLVIGAGGGFDFICGLPIVFDLQAQGHTVHIGNYSFTDLGKIAAAIWHTRNVLEVNADSRHASGDYFPEGQLSAWFRQACATEEPIWCLSQGGVVPTLESYNYLIDTLNIDVIICVDGGVDGILRGDEYELGTPSMDSISVTAASLCKARQRIYVCTAFGIEGAESGLSHAQVLHRMADLAKQNAFLGAMALVHQSAEAQKFHQAAEYVHGQMKPHQKSTIVSSILAAVDGCYGPTAVNAKTQERQPWISPLTTLYWFFQAEEIARAKLYYEQILNSQTVGEVASAIEKVRKNRGVRPYELMPI